MASRGCWAKIVKDLCLKQRVPHNLMQKMSATEPSEPKLVPKIS